MSKGVLRLSRRALILLALCALGGSTASTTLADSGQTSSSYTRLCNAPAPGEMACLSLRRTTPPIASLPAGTSPAAAAAAVSGYGPADLDSAYKLPTTLGSGKTVGIVDAYDDPSVESDLATYRSQFGLPACTTANGCFRKINQNGGTSYPAANSGWAGEIALDVEMVSAACPLCHILLVEATSPTTANLGTAVNQAVAQGAVAVSNSYGGSESSSDPTTSNTYYKHPGVAITVSSGDDGYGVEFPASSPYVTAVGGTTLNKASNSRGWSETAWSGAGSGCSAYETKPSFQHDTGCSRRTVADVSADADPNTGVAVYDSYGSGGWVVFGGTSVASPLIASVYALASPPAAGDYPNAYPYADPSGLFDVTSGSNGSCGGSYLCTGTTGYDGPTGLGTPNGTAAFGPSGTQPPPANDFSVAVSPTSGSVTAGGSTSATVSTAVTSGSSQTVTLSASGAPSGTTVTFSPSSVTTGASSTMNVSTSTSTAAGTYPITITATGASATHTTSYTLTVSGSGGSCSSGQKLVNPGFESGNTGWKATSGVISDSGAPPHSGSWFAWLDGYGRSHTDTLSQTVTIPSGCSSYTLSYWLEINTAETTTTHAYDVLTVKLGSTTLATYSNLNKSSSYVQHSFNISSFAGQTVTLNFTGVEDSSLQTSFLVDDTALTVS